MPPEEELESSARDMLLNNTQPYVKAYAKVWMFVWILSNEKTLQKQLLFPTKPSEGVSEFRPKHCATSICICQYVEKVGNSWTQAKTHEFSESLPQPTTPIRIDHYSNAYYPLLAHPLCLFICVHTISSYSFASSTPRCDSTVHISTPHWYLPM
jgi:hypothetical protein